MPHGGSVKSCQIRKKTRALVRWVSDELNSLSGPVGQILANIFWELTQCQALDKHFTLNFNSATL